MQNDPQTMMKRKVNARITALRSIGKSDAEIADAVLAFPDISETTRTALKNGKASGNVGSVINRLSEITNVQDNLVDTPKQTSGIIGSLGNFFGSEKLGRRIGYAAANALPEWAGGMSNEAKQAVNSLPEEQKRQLQTGGVSGREALGSAAMTGLNLVGGKIAGTALKTLGFSGAPIVAAGARTLTPAQLASRPIATIAGGMATGYAGDVASNLNEGKTGASILAPGFGTVAGGVLGAAPLARNLVKGKGWAGQKAQQNFDKTIDLVAPKISGKEGQKALMNPNVSIDDAGWFKEASANFSKDPQTQRIAQTVQEYVSPKKSYSHNMNAVKNAITETAEKTVKPFLRDNNVPFHFQDLRDRLTMMQPSSGLRADPSAVKNYNRIREEILDDLATSLKKSGEKGRMTDMNELWNARKAIDTRIENELGDFVEFGSPQYRGARAAATDLRREINNFIVDSISNPGQAQELNKFYEFMNVAASRGMKINNTDDAYRLLRQQMGIQDIPEDVAKGAFFKFQLNRMSDMYEAAGNLGAKAKSELGKTKFDKLTGGRGMRSLQGIGTIGAGLGGATYLTRTLTGGGNSND